MGNSEKNSSWGYWDIVVLLFIVGFLVWVSIPNYISSGRHQPQFICINNLRQIDAAKTEWVYEHHLTNGETVTMNQLTNYLRPPVIPKCPSGGTYTIGKVGELPTCSLAKDGSPYHKLPR